MAATEPILPAELAPAQHEQLRRSLSIPRTSDEDNRLSFQDARKGEKESDLLNKLGLGSYARRTLGICCLTITVFLWTLANFLASVSIRATLQSMRMEPKLTSPGAGHVLRQFVR